jgi:hypothetical protein
MTAIRPGDNPALSAATAAMPGIMIKLIMDGAGHAGVVLGHNYPDARHIQHLDCELGVLQAARLILSEHHEHASVDAILPAIARARQRAADLDACLDSFNADPESGS